MDISENIKTLVDVSPPTPGDEPDEAPHLSAAEQDTVRELVRQARANGSALTGPGGSPKQLTKMVVEAALDEEMNEHLGYEPGDPQGRNRGNSRNERRVKTVIIDNADPVEIEVPGAVSKPASHIHNEGPVNLRAGNRAQASAPTDGPGPCLVVAIGQDADHGRDQRASG